MESCWRTSRILLIEAIDRLLDMARIAQRHTALRDLLLSAEPAEALAALDGVDGGTEFRAALEDLLERQGLRSGAGFGTASDPIMPGWREQPTIVVELVQKYVPQDLDALLSARAAAVEARDRRVEEIRDLIAGEEKRREFDFWLDAARRAQQSFEDHNYKIDSAAGSLLHYAITACGRSLSRAGLLETAEDAWWLRAHELSLALRGLDTAVTAATAATVAHGVGRRCAEPGERATSGCVARGGARLVPLAHAPATLGAPAPPDALGPNGRPVQPAAPAPKDVPPGALVTGQTGSAGVATGRVRIADSRAAVPDVEPGDVLVAHNAGPLWTPVFPTVAAVVLNEGVLFQHAMLTSREYGVPAIFQCKDATKQLVEGERVTVDATNGWVLPADERG